MKITKKNISIRELTQGYQNNDIEGVVGYYGRLDVRPKYQREFIYKDRQRNLVMDTVIKNFPLNVMYWVKTGENGKGESLYEVLDGQQRTISICEYVHGNFSIDYKNFGILPEDIKEDILNYELFVYVCEGKESEKLEWFKTINIAGEELTLQELRNAVYASRWLSDAKSKFSKPSSPASDIAGDYLKGSAIRQDYLETVIKWISNDNIEQYMTDHQYDSSANELWLYFNSVINWTKALFPHYRNEMKGVNWGDLYNIYNNQKFDPYLLEEKTKRLMMDDEIKKKQGIYPYLITGKEKHLNLRSFTTSQKRQGYEKQNGICTNCSKHFELKEMEADHITPWHAGGKTDIDNLQLLCKECNRRKSGI